MTEIRFQFCSWNEKEIATPFIFEPVREAASATKTVVKQGYPRPPKRSRSELSFKNRRRGAQTCENSSGIVARAARSRERTREPGSIHSLGLQIQSRKSGFKVLFEVSLPERCRFREKILYKRFAVNDPGFFDPFQFIDLHCAEVN